MFLFPMEQGYKWNVCEHGRLKACPATFSFPGRQMMRHLLIPFLLGFKFNLASLIPLMFGFLLLLTKKALLLTKVALVITGLLGWNSFFSATYPPSGIHHSYEGHGSAFPPHYEHYHNFHHRPPYRGFQGNDLHEPTYYGQHVIREVVDVYDNAADQSNVDKSKGRKNFVWVKSSWLVPLIRCVDRF